jgi:hypothetical protein
MLEANLSAQRFQLQDFAYYSSIKNIPSLGNSLQVAHSIGFLELVSEVMYPKSYIIAQGRAIGFRVENLFAFLRHLNLVVPSCD